MSGVQLGTGSEFWTFDGVDWSPLYAAGSANVQGPAVYSSSHGHAYVYTGAMLAEQSFAPASLTSLGGECGTEPPQLGLRTRARLGSPEFGFEVKATSGDFVVLAVADATGSTPIGSCTALIGGTIWPTLHAVGATGLVSQPMPLPNVPALRGLPCFAQGFAWDLAQPLAALRSSIAWRFVLGD